MKFKRMLFLAPETVGAGGVGQTPAADEGQDDAGFKDVESGLNLDDYAIEGEEGSQNSFQEPEEYRGKSRAELIADMQDRQKALEEEKSRQGLNGNAFAEALKGVLPVQAAPQPLSPPLEGYKVGPVLPSSRMPNETDDAYRQRLEQEFIQNPVQANQRQIQDALAPVVTMMTENLLIMNRELVQRDPEMSKVYTKYSNEVEQLVAQMPPIQKVRNPRAYQDAVATVRARHGTEFMTDEIAARAAEMAADILKNAGLDPELLKQGKTAASAPRPVGTLASPTGSRPPVSSAAKAKTVVPREFARTMEARGMDRDDIIIAYEEYRSSGRA